MPKEICIRVDADPVQIGECRDKVKKREETFSRLASLLSLTGSEVRLKILYLLEEEKELCPCDLADMLNMTVPAVSQHLRKLKDGHIIQSYRKGQTVYYSLSADNLKILKPCFKHIQEQAKKTAIM